jgi:7,8-dihydropterin-6-yl-methyl-4-(beta-D-ribofuranosyl)aminobenzene 5'-phosphate synthase
MMSKNRRFKENRKRAARANQERMEAAGPLALPVLENLELTVVSEFEHEEGFMGEPGVSYLLRTDRGSLLYDIGFGPQHPTFANNASLLELTMAEVDALVISHLHADHMGGVKAQRGQILVPTGWQRPAAAVSRRFVHQKNAP